MSGFADISVFEGLQRNANNAMGFTGDVFTNVDNFSSGGASALTRKFKEKDLEASQEKDTELKKTVRKVIINYGTYSTLKELYDTDVSL